MSLFYDVIQSLPQPTDTSDQCCPVVPTPEHPVAFKHLLREVMAGNAFRYNVRLDAHARTGRFPDEKPAFEVASAIVRLGHRYWLLH